MDIANLGITVNSAQLLLAAERMDKVGGAAKSVENRLYGFNNSTKQTETALTRVADRADGATKAFNGFKNVLQVAGIGLAANEVKQFADAWVNANNMLKAASQASGIQSRSLIQLRSDADNARAGLEEYVDLYARILRNSKELGQSEQNIARATNIVSKAFAVGGAAASEQAAGVLQLGQALGSGVLQGDELRSIRENAPVLAQAIADYFGTTISGLKELGAQGELTSRKVVEAILAAGNNIESQFSKTSITLAQGATLVSNAGLQYIGTMDEMLGVSKTLGSGLKILADNIDIVGTALLAFSAISAGRMFGPMIAGQAKALASVLSLDAAFLKTNATMLNTRSAALARAKAAHDIALADKEAAAAALQAAQADRARAVAAVEAAKAGQLAGVTRAQATAQLIASNKAVNAASLTMAAQSKTTAQTLGVMNVAMKNASFSARAMSIAMGGLSFLGGPLGVAILGIGTAMYIQSERADAARKKSEELHAEWDKLGLIAPTTAENIDKVAASLAALSDGDKFRQLKATREELERLTKDRSNQRGLPFTGDSLQGDELSTIRSKATGASNGSTEDKQATKIIKEQIALVQQYPELAAKARYAIQELLTTNISEDMADVTNSAIRSLDRIQEASNNISLLDPEGEARKLDAMAQKFRDTIGRWQNTPVLKLSDSDYQSLNTMIDQLARGEIEASQLIDKMQSLDLHARSQADFPWLRILAERMGATTQKAEELNAILNKLDGKSIEIGVNATGLGNLQYILGEADKVTKSLEQVGADAIKQASRTPAQVRLDEQKDKLRQQISPDQQGLIDESVLTNQAQAVIDAYDKANKKAKSGGGSKGLERDANAYRDLLKSGEDRIAQMELETQLAGKAGIAADAYRMKLELEQHATDKGRKLTAEKAAEIANLSKRYEEAAIAASKAQLKADLYTDRVRMGLSTVEQGVFDTFKQYGIPYGSDPQLAAAIRYNSVLEMGIGYAQSFANTLTSGLVNGTKFTESLGNAFKNLGNQLLSMATNDIINGLFRNLFGGGGSGGIFGSVLGGLFGGGSGFTAGVAQSVSSSAVNGALRSGTAGLFANGGAFGTGTQRFAKGGTFTNSIVSSPTPFRFADGGGFSNGVMGEAGPEAILPLKRDAQGRLGVSQHGNGGNQGGGTQTSVNVDVRPSKYFDTIVEQKAQEISQQQIKQFAQSPQLKQVAEQVSRSVIKTPSKRF